MRKDAEFKIKGNPTSQLQQNIDIKGLWTYPNDFSQTPAGGLHLAQNCVVDSPGNVESRRGNAFHRPYTGLPDIPLQTLSMVEYNDTLITHVSSGEVCKDNGTSMVAFTGEYTVPVPSDVESRVRFANIQKNLYFTSGAGIYRLDSLTNNPELAGVPPALGGYGTFSGTPGFLANNTNVAYRLIWLHVDANNNINKGAPSDRVIVANTSGNTSNASVTFTIPQGVDTSFTYQLYRSNASATLVSEPDDNMQLVFQASPTPAQITARQITMIDIQPDNLKGATLYTSAEGINQANYRPPFARDIALFKGLTCYSNCTSKQVFFLSLISGSLIVNGDTLRFTRVGGSTITLTAGAAENIATGTFKNVTGGTPSSNITQTATSIVNVLNLYASNTFLDAYYSSGFSEAPGKMTFIDRSLNTNAFYVTFSRTGTIFAPPLPSAGQTNETTSTNNTQPNVIYYSKLEQPEAVPLSNFISVGSSSSPIVRIIALRESLMVIKQDGIFRITGTSASNLQVQPLDVQMRVKSVNSCVALNNMVYAFMDQGIVRINDSGGIEIKSLPIERSLIELATPNFPGFAGATFGIAYPSDHKYILYTVQTPGDIVATRAFVYNYVTDAWTVWGNSFTAGFVRPSTSSLYFGTFDFAGSEIYAERKSLTYTDFADDEYSVYIVDAYDNIVEVSDASVIQVGMSLLQTIPEGVLVSYITAKNGNFITLADSNFAWLVDSDASVFAPIDVKVEIAPMYGDSPNSMKQFSECSLLLDSDSFKSLGIAFSSDQSIGTAQNSQVSNITNGPWGQFRWGQTAWGSLSQESQRVRILIPAQTQKANWITLTVSLKQAFRRMRVSGITVAFRPLTIRQR